MAAEDINRLPDIEQNVDLYIPDINGRQFRTSELCIPEGASTEHLEVYANALGRLASRSLTAKYPLELSVQDVRGRVESMQFADKILAGDRFSRIIVACNGRASDGTLVMEAMTHVQSERGGLLRQRRPHIRQLETANGMVGEGTRYSYQAAAVLKKAMWPYHASQPVTARVETTNREARSFYESKGMVLGELLTDPYVPQGNERGRLFYADMETGSTDVGFFGAMMSAIYGTSRAENT